MSAFDREKIKFGNDTFYVQQFPPFEGMRVLGELQKIIVPVLSGAAVNTDLKGDMERTFVEGVAGGLMTVSDCCPDKEKLEKIFEKKTVEVKSKNFDKNHQKSFFLGNWGIREPGNRMIFPGFGENFKFPAKSKKFFLLLSTGHTLDDRLHSVNRRTHDAAGIAGSLADGIKSRRTYRLKIFPVA